MSSLRLATLMFHLTAEKTTTMRHMQGHTFCSHATMVHQWQQSLVFYGPEVGRAYKRPSAAFRCNVAFQACPRHEHPTMCNIHCCRSVWSSPGHNELRRTANFRPLDWDIWKANFEWYSGKCLVTKATSVKRCVKVMCVGIKSGYSLNTI